MKRLKFEQIAGLAIIALGWLVLFWAPLTDLLAIWDSDDFSYCYLVPFVFAYLLWTTRDRLKNIPTSSSVPGYILLIFSGLFFILGKASSLETIIYLAAWGSLLGVCLTLWGWKSYRHFAFPFTVLLFTIPPPTFISRNLSFRLRLVSSEVAANMLLALSVPVFQDGNIIDLGSMKLEVVDACSGLRYFFPTVFLGLLLGYLLCRTIWARVALTVVSIPVSVLSNALRIAITGVLVKFISPELAEGFFHDFSGFVIFVLSFLLLGIVAQIFRKLERKKVHAKTDVELVEEAGPSLLRLGVIKGSLIGSLFIGIFFLQSAITSNQIIPERKTFETFPLTIAEWEGARTYLSADVLKSLYADDYVLGTYQNTKTGNVLQLLVPYYQHQTTRHFAHAPTSCLLGSGWEIQSKVQLMPNPNSARTIPVHQMIMRKGDQVLLSNFWFQQRGRVISDEIYNKAYIAWDSIKRMRSDGALVRVEMLLLPKQDIGQAQNALDGFIGQLEQILPGYIPS